LLRIDPEVLEAIRRWSDDDMRSMNGQIEFLLRQALRQAGRGPKDKNASDKPNKDKPSKEKPNKRRVSGDDPA
jgi:hypothetical protein